MSPKEAESLGAATLEAPGLARLESAGQDRICWRSCVTFASRPCPSGVDAGVLRAPNPRRGRHLHSLAPQGVEETESGEVLRSGDWKVQGRNAASFRAAEELVQLCHGGSRSLEPRSLQAGLFDSLIGCPRFRFCTRAVCNCRAVGVNQGWSGRNRHWLFLLCSVRSM